MARDLRKGTVLALIVGLLVLAPLFSCSKSGDGTSDEVKPTPTVTAPPKDEVVITIGNLTDLTGPAARGMELVNKAVDDVVRHYNDEGLIPGVKLKVVMYDGQLDANQNEPGYEYLLANGADLIWTGVPGAPESLRYRLEDDGISLFAATITQEELSPPGYIFTAGMVPEINTYTQLKWIAENEWDYETKGRATIGGAGWTDRHSPAIFAATQAYAEAHPDQYEWVGGYLTNYSFSWIEQVQVLKDVDYVLVPNVMTTFAKQYSEAGGTGKMLAGEAQVAFLEQIADAGLWDAVDGTNVIRGSGWWGEDDAMVKLAEELLMKYNSGSADAIRQRGVGYLAVQQAYIVMELVRQAVESGSAETFDSAALYDAAQSLSIEIDALERYSFTDIKRNASNYYAVSEMRADVQDVVRVDDRWIPAVYEP